ncbi:Polycomb group FIE2 [Micractinium conductrix]|uniref:Polycomb group FIE2 n=1 Tax=Micractinium conductrix TaxID=554055 RepID=A0A2P6VQR7_9CHLO|nr:Polycomb group FIE2 [Micractinium conductrix]|eukprot:PSC76443.1 Polycomb group FIE2 [Micractinium conductrix]
MEARQVFVDADPEEEYFVCAWSLDVDTGAPLLLLAGKNGVLLAVNSLTGSLDACFEGHGSCINDIAVHPTRPQFVATASKDQSLRMWNLRTRCCVLVFQGDGGHRNEVLTLSWKPGGGDCLLLSAGMDNHIKLWSLAEHEHTLAASDDWRPGRASFPAGHVTVPVFSTERVHWNYVDCVRGLGDHVLSKSVDNKVVIWRPDRSTKQHTRDGDVELLQELQLEDCANVWWLRFALDHWCTVLAVGTNTGRVLLYDPHVQQPHPKVRLRPQRFNGKGDQRPLVRQTAVSYDEGPLLSLAALAAHSGGAPDPLFPADWLERRLLGKASHPQVPACTLAVNHKYKIIYAKVPKAAGTTAMAYFTNCDDVRSEDHCLQFTNPYNATLMAHLHAHWADYFVFAFTRNVLTRTVSQYQYLSHLMDDECGVAWDSYCVDPYSLGDACQRSPECCHQPAQHHYLHAAPQANCLLTAGGGVAVDYIGRSEAFDEDFTELIRVLNARPGVPRLPERPPPQRRNYNQSPCSKGDGSSSGQQQQQQQQEQQGLRRGGGVQAAGASQRRLAWAVRNSTLNPCDKMELFRGPHAHCLRSIADFYADDVSMLM